jgi:hypothetical protein
MILSALIPATAAALVSVGFFIASEEIAKWTIQGVEAERTKKILELLTTAISAFLGAVMLKAAADADDEWIGSRVKKRFRNAYQRLESGAPRIENGKALYDPNCGPTKVIDTAVYSRTFRDETGWSFEARLERAKAIEKAMTHFPKP